MSWATARSSSGMANARFPCSPANSSGRQGADEGCGRCRTTAASFTLSTWFSSFSRVTLSTWLSSVSRFLRCTVACFLCFLLCFPLTTASFHGADLQGAVARAALVHKAREYEGSKYRSGLGLSGCRVHEGSKYWSGLGLSDCFAHFGCMHCGRGTSLDLGLSSGTGRRCCRWRSERDRNLGRLGDASQVRRGRLTCRAGL
mmetsp:Transcript_100484/g.288559  ORF Transcript_100484/g.288559 Transcript_100484/m.288559 type:complete len:201 (+) Transcript_100484:1124-1726(+)